MKLREIYAISISLVISSCAVRSVYVPVAPQVPLFGEQKELRTSAYLGYNNVQLQIAHNPLPYVFFGVNNMLGAGISTFEGMTGFYHGGGEKGKWRFETQFGGGHTENYAQVDFKLFNFGAPRANTFYETMSIYNKAFVQPSVGYCGSISMYKLKFSFALSSRLSYLYFNRFYYFEGPPVPDPENPPFVRIYSGADMYLLEPCFTNKVERNNLAIIFQLLGVIPYSTQIDLSHVHFSPAIQFNTGLQYRIPFRKRK